MENDELDDKTIVVPRGEIDDATIVVPRDQLDDATIVVPRDIDDATVVVKRPIEDATISFSRPVEDNTVTGASGPQNFTNSFEDSLPVAPTSEINVVNIEDVEEDAELKIETYVDPEEEIRKTRSQKISSENINLSEDSATPNPAAKPKSALHDAQKLMQKNKVRSAGSSKVALIAVFVGVALIGLTLAVLIK
jgi:hypothetical protein